MFCQYSQKVNGISIDRSISLTPVLGKIKQQLTGDLSTEVNIQLYNDNEYELIES